MHDNLGYWIVVKEGDQILAGPFSHRWMAEEELQDPFVDESSTVEDMVITPDYYFQWGEPTIKYGTPDKDFQKLRVKNEGI